MSTYTINEVSSMFGLPASTLRYYEDMGILTQVNRAPGGKRIYSDGHINRLKTICCFKGTGMSIAKLCAFFRFEEEEARHIDDILALLTDQKNQVTGQLIKMQADLKHVNRKLHYYSDIKAAMEANQAPPDWNDYKEKDFDSCSP